MPLFVVRRPNLAAGLVQAEDEADFLRLLSEIEDPQRCRWARYDGPVAFDLDLPVQVDLPDEAYEDPDLPVRPGDVSVGGLGPLVDEGLIAWPAQCEAGQRMLLGIYAIAYPHLAGALARRRATRRTVERALREEVVDERRGAPAAGDGRGASVPDDRGARGPRAPMTPDAGGPERARAGGTGGPATPRAAHDLARMLGVPTAIARRYLASAEGREPAPPADDDGVSPLEAAEVDILVDRWLQESGLAGHSRVDRTDLRDLALRAYRAGRAAGWGVGVAEAAAP